MLILGLNIGNERYGIEATRVIEVVPLIELKKVPLTEKAIKGIFNYRGTSTPVIDLCQLFENRYCSANLSTRIVIIHDVDSAGNTRPIGLVAENITDVMQCQTEKITDSGIQSVNNNFLGKVYKHNNDMIQLIDTQRILPPSISHQLAEKLT